MEQAHSDTTDTKTRPNRRPPRPRKGAAETAATPALPAGYAKARAAFERRAQDWLLSKPGRTMRMPDELPAVTALGVPCKDCGALIYRHRDAGHSVDWKRETPWAAGITATCR